MRKQEVVVVSDVVVGDMLGGAVVWMSEQSEEAAQLWFLGFESDVLGGLRHIIIEPHQLVTVERESTIEDDLRAQITARFEERGCHATDLIEAAVTAAKDTGLLD